MRDRPPRPRVPARQPAPRRSKTGVRYPATLEELDALRSELRAKTRRATLPFQRDSPPPPTVPSPSTSEDLDDLSRRTREKLASLSRRTPAAPSDGIEPPTPAP